MGSILNYASWPQKQDAPCVDTILLLDAPVHFSYPLSKRTLLDAALETTCAIGASVLGSLRHECGDLQVAELGPNSGARNSYSTFERSKPVQCGLQVVFPHSCMKVGLVFYQAAARAIWNGSFALM